MLIFQCLVGNCSSYNHTFDMVRVAKRFLVKYRSILHDVKGLKKALFSSARQLAFFALVTTATVCILCVVEIPKEVSCGPPAPPGGSTGGQPWSPSLLTYLSGFATIIFAFGGAPIFPNILVDMTERSHFKYSAVAAHASKE